MSSKTSSKSRLHPRPHGLTGCIAPVPPRPPAAAARAAIPVPPDKRCTFKTQKGSPCRAARRSDSAFCIFHDRDFQEQHAQARTGAHFFNLRHAPDSPEGIHEILRRNIEAVACGKISPRIANSISYAVQIMIANLPGLQRARDRFNLRLDTTHELEHQFVSAQLDRIEQEIQQAGDHAHPVKIAQTYCQSSSQAPPEEAPAPLPAAADPLPPQQSSPAGPLPAPIPPRRAVAPHCPASSKPSPAAPRPQPGSPPDDFGPPPAWAAEVEAIAARGLPSDPAPSPHRPNGRGSPPRP